MKEYWVRIPLAGSIAINVHAENEDEAKALAFNADWSLQMKGDDVELEELDLYESICTGNVLHAPLNEIEFEEV